MSYVRESRGKTDHADMGARCTEARKAVIAFLDWAHYHNVRKRQEWETWATQRVLAGWTVEQVHEHVKSAWFAHRRAAGKPPRCQLLTRSEFRSLMREIQSKLDTIGVWKALEPWWERVGQPPPTRNSYANIQRNRAAAGLPPGPPWMFGHRWVDPIWQAVEDARIAEERGEDIARDDGPDEYPDNGSAW